MSKGIYCITTPCFSIDEYVLNTNIVDVISDFDLNPVGASDEGLCIALSLFSDNLPLFVAGENKTQQALNGVGVSFIANQLYLPVLPTIKACADDHSLGNDVYY
jgi:hypothetical protein